MTRQQPPSYFPAAEVIPGGPDNTYRWAVVTQINPLRVRLDGDTIELPMTPDTLVDPYGLSVGSRVWVQLFGRRLLIIGAWNGANRGVIRRVAGNNRAVNTANATLTYNIVLSTIPYPVFGRKYRATGTADIQPDTAGMYTSLQIKMGLSALTGGTEITAKYLDHRIADRVVGMTVFGEFDYDGVTGASPFNVVLLGVPSGGGSFAECSATRPATLVVDEIL